MLVHPLVPRALLRQRLRQQRTIASIGDWLLRVAIRSRDAFWEDGVLLFAPVESEGYSARQRIAAEEVVRDLADGYLEDEGVADLVARERRAVAGETLTRLLNKRGVYIATAQRLHDVAKECCDGRVRTLDETPGVESLLTAVRLLVFADALAGEDHVDDRVNKLLADVAPERSELAASRH